MGFLDDLSEVFGKGSVAMSRVADTASMKFKLTDVDRKRREAAARLGEGVYAMVKADPALAAQFKDVIDEMDALAAQRAELQAELDRLEREAAEAKAASAVVVCPTCGAALAPNARFCQACGSFVEEAPRSTQYTACGAPNAAAAQEPARPAAAQEPGFGTAAAQSQQPAAAQVQQTYEVPGDSPEAK